MWKWNAKIGSSPSVGEINMQGMFENSVFNHGINNWNVSKVSNFKNMFKNNTYFNTQLFNWKYKIGGWTGISSVNLEGMFENSVFNQGVSKWDVSKVSNFKNTFKNSQYNKPLEWAKTFDDAKITDLTGFLENTKINNWTLKKYDCRFQHLNGFDKTFGESLPVNSIANISPVAKFNYGSITNDPCSSTGEWSI